MHNKKTLLLQVKQNRQVLIFTLPAIITIVIMFIFPFFPAYDMPVLIGMG